MTTRRLNLDMTLQPSAILGLEAAGNDADLLGDFHASRRVCTSAQDTSSSHCTYTNLSRSDLGRMDIEPSIFDFRFLNESKCLTVSLINLVAEISQTD